MSFFFCGMAQFEGHDFEYRTEDEMSEDDLKSIASKDDFSSATDEKCSIKVGKMRRCSYIGVFRSSLLVGNSMFSNVYMSNSAGQEWEP